MERNLHERQGDSIREGSTTPIVLTPREFISGGGEGVYGNGGSGFIKFIQSRQDDSLRQDSRVVCIH